MVKNGGIQLKNKKIKINKTKILFLLVIVLVICIVLLSASIFFQTRSEDSTIEEIENANNAELILPDPILPPKTAEDYKKSRTKHILRSENGKMQVSSRDGVAVDFNEKNTQNFEENIENAQNGTNFKAGENNLGDGSLGNLGDLGGVSDWGDGSIIFEGEKYNFSDGTDGSTQNGELLALAQNNSSTIDENTQKLLNKSGPDWYDYTNGNANAQNYSITGTLVFVFDDAGHNLSQLQPFLELPFPITVAVLPGLEYSSEAAKKVRSCGKEVILHQPMQAVDLKKDPGPGAIYPEMTSEQIYNIVRHNLASIGPVSGMNNHEGSLITANEKLMAAILDVCRAEQIYFLDSRTSSESKAQMVASMRGMRIWERSVFLDNSQNKSEMQAAVRLGMEQAKKNGLAIMIGHVWSEDLPEVLNDLYPEMLMQGYSIKTISKIQDMY